MNMVIMDQGPGCQAKAGNCCKREQPVQNRDTRHGSQVPARWSPLPVT